MELKKMSVNLYAIQYGLALGVVFIIFDLILYIFKAPIDSWVRYLQYLIMLVFIIYAIINYRNKYSKGFIKYGRSLLTCFLIALYAGIIFAVYKYLFLKFFDHSIVVQVKEFARHKIAEKGNLDEDKVDQIMQMQKWVYTPFVLAMSGIINTAFWGIIFSIIVSLFIKKEDTSFEAATTTTTSTTTTDN
jgi:hypothetical protein